MALEGPQCRAERPTTSATAACGGSKLCWVPSEDTGASMLRQSEASSMGTAVGSSLSSGSGGSSSSWQQLGGKVSSREAIARGLEGLKSSARDQVHGHVYHEISNLLPRGLHSACLNPARLTIRIVFCFSIMQARYISPPCLASCSMALFAKCLQPFMGKNMFFYLCPMRLHLLPVLPTA